MGQSVYLNGAYVDRDEAKISVFDRGFIFGDAIYEVSAVIGGKLIDNAAHLARLERSLSAVRLPLPLTLEEIIVIQKELIARNALREGTVYMQVSRGAADRDFVFPQDAEPTVLLFTQAMTLVDSPSAKRGIKIITVEDLRWKRRDVKSVNLLAPVLAKQAAKDAGADDAWMIEDGLITEGSSNNAFIITHEGIIVTRNLGNHILPGVTRSAVLSFAVQEGLDVEERGFSLEQAFRAREAFVTSATTFVTPVVSIDGRDIGSGKPGELAQKLRQHYIDFALETAD